MHFDSIILIDILALSCGVWMIAFFLMTIIVTRFIVKRYEKETDLLSAVFFREHATFTRILPGYLSSAIYGGHLAISRWGWGIYGKKKIFRDIVSPEEIYGKFSSSELRRVKWLLITGVLLSLHAALILIFQSP